MTRQAAFRIGMVSLAAPELKWPMKTIASGSLAAVVAFCWATAPSQSPLLAADESSRSVYLMVKEPTVLPSRSSLMDSTSAFVCSVFEPWRGSDEYTWISFALVPFLFLQTSGWAAAAPLPLAAGGAADPP